MKMPPDASAFAIAQRNLDAIPAEERNSWFEAVRRASRLSDIAMPERVIVELANTCNLDCPMCRVGEHGVDPRRFMPLERFEALGPQLFAHAREVRLNGLGESTLVPDFERYLDVLQRYPVAVELITNGTGSSSVYREMVRRGHTLLFSWDAATPELFERLRRPARWQPLVDTLTYVAAEALDNGRQDQLHLLFTLQPSNREELPALVALAAKWGIPHVLVNVAKLGSDKWLDDHHAQLLAMFAAADVAAQSVGVHLYLPDHIGAHAVVLPSACSTSGTACDRPWKEVVVRWDLEVQVCNMFNPWVYGNMEAQDFKRIWRGGFAQAFRAHLPGPRPHPYCRGCYYIGGVYARKQR